ncbi:hypothetical protein AEAC466_09535 [Asticcacaulis sp. AC466]|uniref:hypothetical protein n=1 Tax=Asticcacaulis sp. AC466 TaxID=1282362 RepID=UPI0003C409E7|nr:hypothetical protein [Asticcacaulis sp. AC466]ESQ84584.1 hypothetical protein AEAC466_09535 [Asticcacaulis sp. AC466]
MTFLRALLVFAWALMSLTATAVPSAAAATANAADMPCHDMADTGRDMPAPSPIKGTPIAMPCCSQPVLAAASAPVPLLRRTLLSLRLRPAIAAPLIGLPVRLEPRPPKFV